MNDRYGSIAAARCRSSRYYQLTVPGMQQFPVWLDAYRRTEHARTRCLCQKLAQAQKLLYEHEGRGNGRYCHGPHERARNSPRKLMMVVLEIVWRCDR